MRSPIRFLFFSLVTILITGYIVFAINTWNSLKQETYNELNYINQLLLQTTNDVLSLNQSVLHIQGERLIELGVEQNLGQARRLIEQMLQLNPSMAGFGLAQADGQLIILSGVEPDVPLPNLLNQHASAKSFKKAVDTPGMQTGRTYYMQQMNKWVIPLRLAIHDNDGKVALIMITGIDLENKNSTLTTLNLPPGIEIRILRADNYWQFVKPLPGDQIKKTYDTRINKDLNVLLDGMIETGQKYFDNLALFDNVKKTGVFSYLDKFGLYSIVCKPNDILFSEYTARMSGATLLILSFVLGAFGLYNIASKRQHQLENSLLFQANHDTLTGLPNKNLAMDRLDTSIKRSQKQELQTALLLIDLDNFKRVNDSHSHLVGDKLLQHCVNRFKTILLDTYTLARLSGDEFLIIIDYIDASSIDVIADKLLKLFIKPFDIENIKIYCTISIGIATSPQDANSARELLSKADTALYKGKEEGKNNYQFFSSNMNTEASRRLLIENNLRHALDNQELEIHYQPQFNIQTGQCIGAEALLRWHNPEIGQTSPAEFIPIAEETGIIKPIGEFILETTLRDVFIFTEYCSKNFRLAVNVSAKQLHDNSVIKYINKLVKQHPTLPNHLEIEITESVLASNLEQLTILHNLGIRLAIDDFGTGYSSLSYLHRFPARTLKIDREFIRDIETDPEDAVLAKAIIALGHSMGLEIVAEGIETKNQLDFLKENQCNLGQGFYFYRPMPIKDFLKQVCHLSK